MVGSSVTAWIIALVSILFWLALRVHEPLCLKELLSVSLNARLT